MIITIILFVLMLTLILTIHEFGHFVAAKAFGVYCYEFSIGMGPLLYSKKGKETKFSIRALPIGGYVAMAGDDDNNPNIEKPNVEIPKERTLPGIAPLKRIVIMAAGVFMNFLLAIIIVCVSYLSIGQVVDSPKPIIKEVTVNSPAYKAGLKSGDLIKEASYENGYKISPTTFQELSTFLSIYDGKGNVTFVVSRGVEELSIAMKPVFDETENRYLIGITSNDFEVVNIDLSNVLKYSFRYISEVMKITVMTLVGLFRGVGFENVSGPIGIYKVTQEAVSYGFTSYLSLIALISLSVGAFNLVPLPIFDGGRILLTFIEMIIGRPLNKKVENAIMTISLGLILLLVIYTTVKDVFGLVR